MYFMMQFVVELYEFFKESIWYMHLSANDCWVLDGAFVPKDIMLTFFACMSSLW